VTRCATAILLLTAVSAAFAGLPATAAQAPASFYEARALEPAAAYVAGKPVTVWCAVTESAWHAETRSRGLFGDPYGFAKTGGSEFSLKPDLCAILARAASGSVSTIDLQSLAPSIQTLTHESIHLRGVRDEGETDCRAIHEMPRVAVRFFHVKPGRQLRALMAAAWAWHRAQPLTYQSVC
jgi:hypothetical protein